MESLKSAFRITSFIQPDYLFTIEVYLYLQGFHEFKTIAKIIVKCLESIENKLKLKFLLS